MRTVQPAVLAIDKLPNKLLRACAIKPVASATSAHVGIQRTTPAISCDCGQPAERWTADEWQSTLCNKCESAAHHPASLIISPLPSRAGVLPSYLSQQFECLPTGLQAGTLGSLALLMRCQRVPPLVVDIGPLTLMCRCAHLANAPETHLPHAAAGPGPQLSLRRAHPCGRGLPTELRVGAVWHERGHSGSFLFSKMPL